ncbi:MAG: nuclear transport factor 2 family protein [Anaerolineaceae bacterium]|nr:nuclear transport factor 2 family protein [Anaerolineaceae bacterium]
MSLTGKGFMIWQVPRCEKGNPAAITSVAQAAGLNNVLIKIADGINPYNIDKTNNNDLVGPVVQALKQKKIEVWGWHYLYGADPVGEAKMAIKRVTDLSLSGYVIDAEVEFQQPGRDVAARTFMNTLRASLPNLPVALCSFRYPSLHPQIPWKDFLNKCDFNMPQVYWDHAHNPDAQLRRCVSEFQAMTPSRPVIPTGPVYKSGDWTASPAEIIQFMDTAKALDLKSANFFAWDYGRWILEPVWDAISAYSWGPYPYPKDITDTFIAALNTHDVNKIIALYASTAVHVTAAQTIQGTAAIKSWFNTFLTQTLPNAKFSMTGTSGTGDSRHFTWTAASAKGKITNGTDTFGIYNNQITYHYSSYTITPA